MKIKLFAPRNGEQVKLFLLDGHPGFAEVKRGVGFQSYYVKDLKAILADVGISFHDSARSYVFETMPPANNLVNLCGTKKEVTTEAKEKKWGSYNYPPLTLGKYLRPDYFVELFRLKEELERVKPYLVVALGQVPLWAMTKISGIEKYRGSIMESHLVPGQKVLPVYSPAMIHKDYSKRVILIADMMKAARECEFPEIRRPPRRVYIAETIQDIREFREAKLMYGNISIDLETLKHRFISCISFAPSPEESLVIPIISSDHAGKKHWAYWKSWTEELQVWEEIYLICTNRATQKIYQNGLYDIQYKLSVGIPVYNAVFDTMLNQHVMYSELPKSLGFLGSILTDEIAWKTLRPRGQKTEYKRDA